MQLSDAGYGEQQAFQEIQSGAKMANTGSQAGPQSGSGQASPIVGLGAPSQMPDEPVTAGAHYGPGAGPEALGIQSPTTRDADALKKYLPTLIEIADRDDTLPGTKQWVRSIIASMSGS
jgi:hypothetical protein